MNPSEHGDTTMLGKEHTEDVKEEDVDSTPAAESLLAAAEAQNQASVKWSSELCPSKRARVSAKMSQLHQFEPLCLSTGEEKRERSRPSYRKPLFGISHRISEKRNASSSEENAPPGFSAVLPPPGQTNAHENGGSQEDRGSPKPSDLYPLIEKMFFILNTLNSSMTQLHSKVDLLTLEVVRIKKQIKPAELASEFRPPPEYLLTREELGQVMEQTTDAGELGCRLLVHLFPELFKARECSCAAGRRSLESLHLQLIRNYVEVCYPSVKSNDVWRDECLGQVNDFFNHFWAQRDMEGSRLLGKQSTSPERPQTYHFIDEQGQEERLSLDNHQSSQALSGLALNIQATEELDEFSSPEDFVLFLLRRLFPEVFEEGKMPENGCGSAGQLTLDPDKIKIIRRYMEANFPDVSEESWLQVCIQHMEDALEGPHSNGSEADHPADDGCDLTCLSGDGANIRLPEVFDLDRCHRKSRKPLLPPVDFNDLEMPSPGFPVPEEHLLSREQLKSNYECSLSVGNFASRLLVLLFPELFTPENTRKLYNCSGSLGKKQLDPVRMNLLRHYIQLVYPPASNDRVWILEFVGKIDERCRRRDTEQRKSNAQQRKLTEDSEPDFLAQLNPELFRGEPDLPLITPEKSNKDFCKIPLEELTVSVPDFPVPAGYLLSSVEVREIVQQSLSVGNFAARLLVRLFPELFTQENLRLQYNHSGACNKKQLDPVRLRLIRHYVETVFPVDKMEEVWHYECVPSIDERCRRPNRKKCDILKKAKRSSTVS